jgi:hypothetical protein
VHFSERITSDEWKLSAGRHFFDEFAKSRNFYPLDANRWYSVSRKEISRAVCWTPKTVCYFNFTIKGGDRILKRFKGLHVDALIKLYPELKLQKKYFLYYRGNHCTLVMTSCLIIPTARAKRTISDKDE